MSTHSHPLGLGVQSPESIRLSGGGTAQSSEAGSGPFGMEFWGLGYPESGLDLWSWSFGAHLPGPVDSSFCGERRGWQRPRKGSLNHLKMTTPPSCLIHGSMGPKALSWATAPLVKLVGETVPLQWPVAFPGWTVPCSPPVLGLGGCGGGLGVMSPPGSVCGVGEGAGLQGALAQPLTHQETINRQTLNLSAN